MTIDRLNPLGPIQPKKTQNVQNVSRNSGIDSVSLSSEAVEKAEFLRTIELVKASPEIRMDKVEEIRAKLEDPNYINDLILGETADRILDQLL